MNASAHSVDDVLTRVTALAIVIATALTAVVGPLLLG